jgi:hypothetical protein
MVMNDEVERMWKAAAVAYFKALSQHLFAMRKTMKNLNLQAKNETLDL